MNNARDPIGVVTLDDRGRELAERLARAGVAVLLFDPLETGRGASADVHLPSAAKLDELLAALAPPRRVMLSGAADATLGTVANALATRLRPGDVLIDASLAPFQDAGRLMRECSALGLHYVGVGFALQPDGASLMLGGDPVLGPVVWPVLAPAAATFQGRACIAWVGEGPIAHLARTVHDAIAQTLVVLLDETLELMTHGLGIGRHACLCALHHWHRAVIDSPIVDITTRAIRVGDGSGPGQTLGVPRGHFDEGAAARWCSTLALQIGAPVPLIASGASYRSHHEAQRPRGDPWPPAPPPQAMLVPLGRALRTALHVSYAEGLHLLSRVAEQLDFGIDLGAVTGTWCAGSPLRGEGSVALQRLYLHSHGVSDPLLHPGFMEGVLSDRRHLVRVVRTAVECGIPVPAHRAALAELDSYGNHTVRLNRERNRKPQTHPAGTCTGTSALEPDRQSAYDPAQGIPSAMVGEHAGHA